MRILLLTLLLTGCYQSVNQNDIQTAIRACGSLEQVQEVDSRFDGHEVVTCMNRQRIILDERVYAK